jgi:hypothetical protein
MNKDIEWLEELPYSKQQWRRERICNLNLDPAESSRKKNWIVKHSGERVKVENRYIRIIMEIQFLIFISDRWKQSQAYRLVKSKQSAVKIVCNCEENGLWELGNKVLTEIWMYMDKTTKNWRKMRNTKSLLIYNLHLIQLSGIEKTIGSSTEEGRNSQY